VVRAIIESLKAFELVALLNFSKSRVIDLLFEVPLIFFTNFLNFYL
jgi:hypothetical protein